MYVTYETRQWSEQTRRLQALLRYTEPPKQFSMLPKPEFFPSLLVCTSDMQVVPGSTVNEGYCALSYSWNWSGVIIEDELTGKTQREDQGKHKIIYPAKTIRLKPRGRKRIRRQTKFVQFQGIIQQLCKDFNIRYIWYDQICIDQDDREQKCREIRLMHEIYSNAYCTVALIPEFQTYRGRSRKSGLRMHTPSFGKLTDSQWISRLWTLEEAMLSPRLLFVGRNLHAWWYTARRYAKISTICQKPARYNVSTVLHYAHRRTSTKEHDRVFAIANLFPEIRNNITINYDQPILDLLIQFYGLLAKMDLSILCFGCAQHLNASIHRPMVHQEYDLLTWCGAAGDHLRQYSHFLWQNPPDTVEDIAPYIREIGSLETAFKNYSINEWSLQVTCASVSKSDTSSFLDLTSDETPALLNLQDEDLPPLRAEHTHTNKSHWLLAVSIQLPSHNNKRKIIHLGVASTETRKAILDRANEELSLLSHFIPIEKEDLFWVKSNSSSKPYYASFSKFSLTEEIRASSQYVVLSGIAFDNIDPWKLCPVIRKNGNHYKAIGTCEVVNPEYLCQDTVEQTFIIQ